MDSVDATSLPRVDPRPQLTPVQHQYGTRIRQNSVIKPSARLRQFPDPLPPPRKLKSMSIPKPMPSPSSPQDMPVFPPPHVILHPEDASSKVLLAIGRSFLSVDNRAMTIKDLADMTLKYGLVCQNVSAAGQAITTYIRNHMQRCDAQQDHPLLLRHVLSGTPADDELLPALHSRTGGAHCTVHPEHRSTNFRRGTMVWYLSRATGAPCPFQRAGIRLCEYGENGKVGSGAAVSDRSRDRDRLRRGEQCGHKRKRVLRGWPDKGSDSDSAEEGKRPAKVKLTLRLRCQSTIKDHPRASSHPKDFIDLSNDSDSDASIDDSMSVGFSDDEDAPTAASKSHEVPWSLPPYPRRSISIPCYTPSVESSHPAFPTPHTNDLMVSCRRSPSVPLSVASPPPDSEDEDDDYHISMTDSRPFSSPVPVGHDEYADMDFDFDSSGEGETETQWESPGPRSPSAPFPCRSLDDIIVKQEPTDIHGMLQAWEDMDSNIADAKVVEVVAQAAAGLVGSDTTSKVKVEELQEWDWEHAYGGANSPDWLSSSLDHEDNTQIKQEEEDCVVTLSPADEMYMPPSMEFDTGLPSPLTPLSSSSSYSNSPPNLAELRRHSELTWKDVELLGPDSINLREFEDGDWHGVVPNGTIRARSNTSPSLPLHPAKIQAVVPTLRSASHRSEILSAAKILTEAFQPPSVPPVDRFFSEAMSDLATSPSSSANSLLSLASRPPSQTETKECDHVVVVHTCQPCTPAISATQVEGISVYQMNLQASPLLRRIDTDFVNISPIINYLGSSSPPPTTFHNVTLINKGSSAVCGTWVPLAAAQAFVKDRPLPDGLLDVFLSDVLFERFPPALQDFHRSNAPGRLLNQFGPHFKSTLDAKWHSQSALEIVNKDAPPWERGLSSLDWDVEDHLLSIHTPFALNVGAIRPTSEDVLVTETPLSPTEQEMFQALCAIPDWDKENSALVTTSSKEKPSSEEAPVGDDFSSPAFIDRPLRRSKRVADAMAARSRTRSRKRGSRNSLS